MQQEFILTMSVKCKWKSELHGWNVAKDPILVLSCSREVFHFMCTSVANCLHLCSGLALGSIYSPLWDAGSGTGLLLRVLHLALWLQLWPSWQTATPPTSSMQMILTHEHASVLWCRETHTHTHMHTHIHRCMHQACWNTCCYMGEWHILISRHSHASICHIVLRH